MPPNQPIYRITVLGDRGVGKTTFIEKMMECGEDTEHDEDRHSELYKMNVTPDDDLERELELSDPGTEKTGLRLMSINRAEAFVLMYSSARVESFHYMVSIIKELPREDNQLVLPLLLFANVWDSESAEKQEQISEDGRILSDHLGSNCFFLKSSALSFTTAAGVAQTFIEMIDKQNPEKLFDESETKSCLCVLL